VTVFVPVNGTVVIARSSPRPFSSTWKSWIEDLSDTTSVYVPALRVLTAFPFFFSEIVKPGPTVPTSLGVTDDAGAAASTAMPAAASSVQIIFMPGVRCEPPGGFLDDLEAALHGLEAPVAG